MRTLAPDCIKLGFGMMRLPKREDGTIDVETTAQMVDEFLAAGGKYVDTAFVYEGSRTPCGRRWLSATRATRTTLRRS